MATTSNYASKSLQKRAVDTCSFGPTTPKDGESEAKDSAHGQD